MNVSGIESTTHVLHDASNQTQEDQNTSGLFRQFVAAINTDQVNADQAMHQFMTGENDSVQHVVSEMIKSELSFHLFMEVRNQVIESYNELMRMQV